MGLRSIRRGFRGRRTLSLRCFKPALYLLSLEPLEPLPGIEPGTRPWQGLALPLRHSDKVLSLGPRLFPSREDSTEPRDAVSAPLGATLHQPLLRWARCSRCQESWGTHGSLASESDRGPSAYHADALPLRQRGMSTSLHDESNADQLLTRQPHCHCAMEAELDPRLELGEHSVRRNAVPCTSSMRGSAGSRTRFSSLEDWHSTTTVSKPRYLQSASVD